MAEYVVLKEAAIGPSYVVLPPQLTVEDILDIKLRTDVNLYRIPFGPARGALVPRRLINMNWKLKRGEKFIEVAKEHGRLLLGNELIRKISKAYKGVKGVVWTTVRDPVTGEVKTTCYPRKALAQKKWKEEKPELVREYEAALAKVPAKAAKPAVRFVYLTP